MNKILLTGSSGFVGSYLTTHFNSIDLSIFGLSINGGYDISNYESISRIEGEYDLFIHCASAFNGDDIDSCIQNEMINSIGALNICKLALKVKCRFFIYFSSISVIENPANEYYNSYGISKKHAEDNIIFFCKKNNIKCLILRFSQIYDSEGKAKHHQPFLYNIIEKVKNDEEILIYGSKNPVRNFIHIDDVCEIVTQSFNKKLEGSYHCIHPNSYTLLEIIKIAGNILNKTPKIRILLDKNNISSIFIPNDFSIYDILSYYPKINLEDGIKNIISRL